MWRCLGLFAFAVSLLLLAAGAGCSTVSVRIIDDSTRLPLRNVQLQLRTKHVDLMDVLMLLPGDHRVVAVGYTDQEGLVTFRHVDLAKSIISIGSDFYPCLYAEESDGSRWWFQDRTGSHPLDITDGVIVAPLTRARP
jgi:hypothetical protein